MIPKLLKMTKCAQGKEALVSRTQDTRTDRTCRKKESANRGVSSMGVLRKSTHFHLFPMQFQLGGKKGK